MAVVNSVTDPVLGAVASAAPAVVGTVRTSVTPKRIVLVVAPGANWPANTRPQSLSSNPAPEHGHANSTKQISVGASKAIFAGRTVPAGITLFHATTDVIAGECETGAA